VPRKQIADVEPATSPVIYLMDRPGSVQSVILASQLIPPKSSPGEIAAETMTVILGGSFTSRMNMNLREDKHWSYGARSQVLATRGQRLLTTVAPVQTDKTKEAVLEVIKEHREIAGNRPPSREELERVQRNRTLSQTGRWETMRAVSGSIHQIVTYGLPDDYFQTYPDELRALDVTDLASAATRVIRPDGLTWIVVGDLEQIEAGIRELGLAEVHVIDADGTVVR
jgi:zinc protease